MLRKINTALGIVAVIGALFVSGVFAYTHLSDIEDSNIVKELGGV